MSLAKYYGGLALVQTSLMLWWMSRGSTGAALISVVGLIGLAALYLTAKRRLRKMNEYFDSVQAELR